MTAGTYLTLATAGDKSAAFPWPPRPQGVFSYPPVTSTQGSQHVWAQAPYSTTLPFTPPSGPDLGFYRNNFCGRRVEGLVWQPGMAGSASTGPVLAMDYDLWKFQTNSSFIGPLSPEASIDLIYAAKIAAGHTHFQFSIEEGVARGWSTGDIIRVIKKWQSLGGYADIWFCSGFVWSHQDMLWSTLGPILKPWVENLLAEDAMDVATLGWQLNQWLGGVPCIDNILGLGAALKSRVKFYGTHWANDACCMWGDGTKEKYGVDDRFQYYAFMAAQMPDHNRVWGQTDVTAPVNGTQAWAGDVMRSLCGTQQFVPYEYYAQNAFNNPDVYTEAEANSVGRIILCGHATGQDGTPKVSAGFGGGASQPNGSVL